MSCQTCLSDLRGPPGFVPPCCGTPICASCVAANPRLTSWVPCLRCGSSSSSTPKPVNETGIKTTQVAGGQAPKKTKNEEVEDQFVLVGSDDEDGDGAGVEGGRGKEDEGGEGGGEDGKVGEAEKRSPSPEIVEITHVPRRGETLLTIARKYANDPHTLLALNDLPHAALYANPSLIRTRPTLIVSRRLVNASRTLDVDVTETPERKSERALARFQAISRAEEGVAKAYLALHAESDSKDGQAGAGQAFQRGLEGGGEVMFDFNDGEETERRVKEGRGEISEKEKGGSGEGPQAALEHYFDDETWEAGAARPQRGKDGKWTVVGAVLPAGVKSEK